MIRSCQSLRFNLQRKPRRALAGKKVDCRCVTARQGIVTPEMECVAIRENQRRAAYFTNSSKSGPEREVGNGRVGRQHAGQLAGASVPRRNYARICARRNRAWSVRDRPGQYQPLLKLNR